MGQSQASRAISLDETASIQLRNAHAELQVYRTAVAQEQERSRRLDGAIYRLRREAADARDELVLYASAAAASAALVVGAGALAFVARGAGAQRAKAAGLAKQLARARADGEHAAARHARELADAKRYGVEPLVKRAIGVADQLGYALAAARAPPSSAAAPPAEQQLAALRDGVALTARELEKSLGEVGAELIAPAPRAGERFDPAVHEASHPVPTDEVAPGEIVELLQTGYSLHGRVLRPARVGVAVAKTPEQG